MPKKGARGRGGGGGALFVAGSFTSQQQARCISEIGNAVSCPTETEAKCI